VEARAQAAPQRNGISPPTLTRYDGRWRLNVKAESRNRGPREGELEQRGRGELAGVDVELELEQRLLGAGGVHQGELAGVDVERGRGRGELAGVHQGELELEQRLLGAGVDGELEQRLLGAGGVHQGELAGVELELEQRGRGPGELAGVHQGELELEQRFLGAGGVHQGELAGVHTFPSRGGTMNEAA
jgi:hypothetical protein